MKNYILLFPLLFFLIACSRDRIISPAIDAIRCFNKNSGSMLWEFRSSSNSLGGEFGWDSSYENDIYNDHYFVGKYPIDVFTGQSKWKFGDGQGHGAFSGLPAFDSDKNMLYYSGPRSFFKIRMPE